MKKLDLAAYIDHTLLRPTATKNDIINLCNEAKKYHFASVCVNPCYTSLVAHQLTGSDVCTCCVISFPFGADPTASKVFAARQALSDGAQEIDMVINIGAALEKEYQFVQDEIAQVVKAALPAKVKVILETCYFTPEEIKQLCLAAKAAGAAFVKTSTGYGKGGATTADVKLMRSTVGASMGVKASGGIRDRETAEAMIEAGANRLGTSSGTSLI